MKPTRINTLPHDYRAAIIGRVQERSRTADSGCIEWTGTLDRYGYGKLTVTIDGWKRQTGAHRAVWLASVGDIPGDLMIDHLCRNRGCVNVEHMELVTGGENTRRGELKGKSGTRPGGQRLNCLKHGRDDGYIYEHPATGYRAWVCRVCRRKASAAYKARLRAS